MSFLAPGFLSLTLVALAGLFVAHLLSRSRPRETPLPTARFVPEAAARAPTRARMPTDLLLLTLRSAIVVLVGAAFAGPRVASARRDVARVFAVDVSSHVASDAGARAELLAGLGELHRDGDALVAFDTAVRAVASLDSLFSSAASDAPGSLSVGLIAAMRAASAMAHSADSVELVIASPITLKEVDSATLAIRAGWPGRIRLLRGPASEGAVVRAPVQVVASNDDPLRATVALGGGMSDAEIRVVRGIAGAVDSVWAREAGHVLLLWPQARDDRGRAVRAAGDSIGAVVAGSRVVVASFARGAAPPGGRVVARWMDGSPAATEAAHGAGCIRSVEVALPDAGDLALRTDFGLFVQELLAPCGGRRTSSPAPDATLAALAGDGPLADSREIGGRRDTGFRLAGWLLAAALGLAFLEHLLRRTVRASADADEGHRNALSPRGRSKVAEA